MAQSVTFGHLDIGFDDTVLRPRPWTTAQSQWAADLLADLDSPLRVLELCAGVGHIGLLALSLARSPTVGHGLVAVDLNPAACHHARRNAAVNGLGPSVEVREGRVDVVLAREESFDLVIADPPWVRQAETSRFPDDPLVAIDGGPDGLDVAWQCIDAATRHLKISGSLLLQLGSMRQVDHVRQLLPATAPSLSTHETRSFEPHGVLVRLTKGAT